MDKTICSCHTPVRFFLSKRPVVFALECVVAMAIAVAGAWLASKTGSKLNGKANADVRSSFALQALVSIERDRLAAENRVAAAFEAMTVKAAQPVVAVKRRQMTAAEGAYIAARPECFWDAFLGSDNQIHPDYCRQ